MPGLLVADPGPEWLPASTLVSGERLDEVLDAAKQRWGAALPAAAALAWRSYVYWLALPMVLGWATARRVLLPDPGDVLLKVAVDHARPLLTLGLRRFRVAALAGTPEPGVSFVTSEADLAERLRVAVRDTHVDPLLARIQTRVRLGTRSLLGSLASAVAYGVVRGLAAPPAVQAEMARTLLTTLGVADLVTLSQEDALSQAEATRWSRPGRSAGGAEAGDLAQGLAVRRHTCCLAFTLPEPKLCSGCCVPRTALG